MSKEVLTAIGRQELLDEIVRLRVERDEALKSAAYAKAQYEAADAALGAALESTKMLQKEVAEALSRLPKN
jgi:hypothetical protein